MRDEKKRVTVSKDAIVTMCYVVKDLSESVLDDTHALTPVKFVCGDGTFFSELERQIQGMGPGQKQTVLIPSELGYGKRKTENTLKIRRNEVPQVDCVVGGLLRRLNAKLESEIYTITGYVGEWLFLDKNHPWAGKDLQYDIRIIAVEQGPSKDSPFEQSKLRDLFKPSGKKESDDEK